MDVNQLWLWMQFLTKKLLSGEIQPDAFNLALNAVNIDFFNLKCGLPQEYQPNHPMPRQAYEVSVKITDDIKHLRKRVTLANNGFNIYILPTDYGAFSSVRYPRYIETHGKQILDWTTVDILTDEDYNERQGSKLLPITAKSPCGCYMQTSGGTGWEIPVSEITTINLTYLRIPTTPVFGFTMVNDEPEYNPATSTQLDWPVTTHQDFVIALCRYVGIYLNAPELWQMLGARAQSGQA